MEYCILKVMYAVEQNGAGSWD